MEIYAYYLPQYHEIYENNVWWGNGFTEWTNVKKAKSLFNKHNQPRIPLNDNYYCLLNIDTLKWQALLANKYGVDGFVFYHYYFCGKKLLEKPAELLLDNEDIPMNFFFCWANHDWNRAWKNSREILMKQTYGDINDWEEHFKYLLNFFKDIRYKKINNKPVFMIFNTVFTEKNDIIEYFNNRCIEEGFSGIHIIESYNGLVDIESFEKNKTNYTYSLVRREPDYSLNYYKTKRFIISKINEKIKRFLCEYISSRFVKQYKADKIYDVMCTVNIKSNTDVIPGFFFEWDNTSRHGKRGFIISPVSENKFQQFMKKNMNNNCSMLICNAWNEWCEGMYLEPDTQNEYKYLEWIRKYRGD